MEQSRSTVYVYALSDPTSGDVRYVGKTQNPRQRLQGHYSAARKEAHLYKSRWIRSLLAQGGQPVMAILEECSSQAEASAVEKRIIAQLRQAGAPLTNGSVGGEVGDWSRQSAEWQTKDRLWRERIGAAARRAWQDPDYRQRMLTIFRSAEYREALAARTRAMMERRRALGLQSVFADRERMAPVHAARCARQRSPEGRARYAAGSKRMWQDPAYRTKALAERRSRGAAGTAVARAALAAAIDNPSVRDRLRWARGHKQSPETIAKRVAATRATKEAKARLAMMTEQDT